MSASEFTGKREYHQQEEVYYDDGRELELLKRIFGLPEDRLSKLRGNPKAILDTIDEFATEKYLMNVGELKGKHVVELISTKKPKISLELGGYVGYSTLLFGSTVRDVSGPEAKYYCIEHNPVFASIIMAFVSLAGLSDTVKVIIGDSGSTIKRLYDEGTLSVVDFIFLDHLKPQYTPDLKTCERLGLVRPGTVIAADNMVKPGNPLYHQYVNMTPAQKVAAGEGMDHHVLGNPRLVYENTFIKSWEPQGVPDAVEISHCVDEI